MKRVVFLCISVAITVVLLSGNADASIVIDGNLEWLGEEGAGVFSEDGVTSQWVYDPSYGWYNAYGYVGPGWGGQPFDLEKLSFSGISQFLLHSVYALKIIKNIILPELSIYRKRLL